jgi:sigma-B regulation protein RsbU (phosphoserine phosphatase)
METSNVSMALVTPDGRLDVVNEALCELLGYDEQTLRTKTWQELTPQHYLEDDRTAIEDLLAGSIDTYRVNKQYIHAGGHLVWVDLSVSCLRDAAGEVQYLVAQGVDISEEIAAQERLARSEMENRLLADRLQSEMLSAAGYVESILPRDLPGPVEVSSRYLPALDLGGDCFHYRWLDDDHLEVYLIDVSGHGIRPAFLSVSVHNLIRSGSLPPSILLNPDRVLEAVNNLFPMEDQADSYLTMWCGIYQPSTRTLRYASAGHPPALALDRDSDGVTAAGLSTVGCPIGMFPDSVYTCESYAVPRGGQLLLYSDGAFDLSLDGRPLTREEFVGLCTELAAQPDWSLDDLVGRLRALSPTGDFDDDCALVLLTFP